MIFKMSTILFDDKKYIKLYITQKNIIKINKLVFSINRVL